MAQRLLLLAPLLLLGFAPDVRSDGGYEALSYERISNILRTKTLSVDFEETDLGEVVAFFHTVTGVNIVVDPLLGRERSAEELKVTLRVDDLPAGDVLDLVLKFKNLGRAYRHGVLLITTPEKSSGKPVLRTYDVRDLTFKIQDFPGPDIELKGSEEGGMAPSFVEPADTTETIDTEMISDLIRSTCGGASWDENPDVRITEVSGVLWIRQTAGVHVEILKLLALLRGLR